MFKSDELNNYPNLRCIEGMGHEKVRLQLEQIIIPFQIVSMYAAGEFHYCWIATAQPVEVVDRLKRQHVNLKKIQEENTRKTISEEVSDKIASEDKKEKE